MPNPTREEVEAEVKQFTDAMEQSGTEDASTGAAGAVVDAGGKVATDAPAEEITVEPEVNAAAKADGERAGWVEPDPNAEKAPEGLKAADPTKENDAAYWKQRANSINGMMRADKERHVLHDAEQARLLEEYKTLALAKGVTTTDQTTDQPSPEGQVFGVKAEDVSEEDVRNTVSSEQIDDFGVEYWQTAIAIQRSGAAKLKAELAADNQKALEEARRNADATERFWQEADAVLPGARQINDTDPEWNRYLDANDPHYGVPRRQLLQNATPTVVAGAIAEYRASAGGATGGSPRNDPAAAIAGQAIARGTAGASASPAQKPTYTMSQVDKFYDDLAKGNYGGTPEDAKKIQTQILAAFEDGRVNMRG